MININAILLLIFFGICNTKVYKYYSYDEIFSTFKSLSQNCSRYIKIDTSQNRYGLDGVPGCGQSNCLNLIVYLTDFDSYTLDRPQFYVSGLVHGNEVIGASSLVEFAKYFCDYQNKTNSLYHNILKTKMFIITPMTNAYGYYNYQREDRLVYRGSGKVETADPNRDFPYFNSNSSMAGPCMRTITGRTINEIFNEHIVSGGITFHGGTSVLGYAWGNFVHKKGRESTEAPDFAAFKEIGISMKNAASSEKNKKTNIVDYELGDMTRTVYAVDGGLEDWAYGGSWENDYTEIKPIKQCEAKTFSAYNMTWDNKIDTDQYKLRCLMYLAEASNDKKPLESTLGNDSDFIYRDLFDFNSVKDYYGHIPRNMRLVYTGADLIYGSIFLDRNQTTIKVKEDHTIDIIIPYTLMGCKTLGKLTLYKYSFHTFTNDTFPLSNIIKKSTEVTVIDNPVCYWSDFSHNANISIETSISDEKRKGSLFSLESKGSLFFLRGEAPDKEWLTQVTPDPNVSPQSHVVQSKTDKDYYIWNGNYSIGSNYFFDSLPVLVLDNGFVSIVDDIDALLYEGGGTVNLIPIEGTSIPSDYTVSSLVDLRQREMSHKGIIFSSEIVYDIDVVVLLSKNSGKASNKIGKEFSKKGKVNAKIALSDMNEELNSTEIICDVYVNKDNKDIIVKCDSIFSAKNVTSYFIRNNLANSLFSLNFNVEEDTINYIGVFSIDKLYRGKYYISDNSDYFCSSYLNFDKNETTLKSSILSKNFLISIKRKANTVLSVTFDSSSFNSFVTYLVIFPFTAQYEFFTEKRDVEIKIEKESNGKILGKTVYVFTITNEKTLNFIKDFLKKKNYLNFLLEIKNMFNTDIKTYQCSIMSTKIYNEFNFNTIKQLAPKNQVPIEEDHLYMYLLYGAIGILGTIVVFILAKLIWKYICKKYCFKEYYQLPTKQDIEIMDLKI